MPLCDEVCAHFMSPAIGQFNYYVIINIHLYEILQFTLDYKRIVK